MELIATIPALLDRRSSDSRVVLRKKERGLWKAVTWSELDAHRRAVAAALQAAGFRQGDVAGLLSETTPDAVYVDLGILSAGGVSLAVNPDAEAEQLRSQLRDSGCRVLFVENEEQLDKALTVRESCPALTRIVILNMKGLRDFSDAGCEDYQVFLGRGTAGGDAPAIRGDHPAVLLPSGVLTHADVLAKVAKAAETLGVRDGDERLAVLPMSDPLERIQGLYLALQAGIVSNYLESPETARENLQELKPTLFGADAEAWTRLHARIAASAAAATPLQRMLYNWAIRAGSGNAVANFLVLGAVRRELGMNRLRVAYVAGSKPAADIAQWAASLGIRIATVEV